jgi:hypothetical protein
MEHCEWRVRDTYYISEATTFTFVTPFKRFRDNSKFNIFPTNKANLEAILCLMFSVVVLEASHSLPH